MSTSPTANLGRRDLWTAAVASLSDEDRSHIDFQRPKKLEVLSDLLHLTNKEIERVENSRFCYKRKNGENVIVKDLFAKIVKWIDHFKQVGDVAVQYDPMHASLPWAGIRFLLEVAISDVKTMELILEHVVALAEIVCRYAVFEDLFLTSPSAAASELEKAVLGLYTKIMLYLAKSKAYFHDNTVKRSMKNMLLMTPDLQTHFHAIESAQVDVDRCAAMVDVQDQLDRHAELRKLLEDMDAPLVRSAKTLDEIKDDLDVAKRPKILQWMSDEPYDSHHKQARSDVLEGTGQWLITDPTYVKWRKDSASSILWLHGIPGSGKSKLVSLVIDEALKSHKNGLCPHPPVFFYCSRNPAEPGRSQPRVIIASILRQLARLDSMGSLLQPVTTAYQEQEKRGFTQSHLDLQDSMELIMQLLPLHSMVTIVIDALDECDPETRGDLLESLEMILQNSPTLVKIFVSSRDDQDIVCHLANYPNLELSSDRNSHDINRFVEFETERLIKGSKLLRYSANKDELKALIICNISNGADGMFRWVSLQLQALCRQKTDQAIRQRIGKLPPKLEDLYRELLERIEQNPERADRQYAQNTLSWLLSAQETLTSEKFLIAISRRIGLDSAPPTKDQILDLCCNLIHSDSPISQ
ncbi:hypothetical protein FE257_002861 [Aspergillus nanangensis]|uniref:NACHT domain-containing protein n=1 Tax=Aspergillus nanangensis TaxID=2582783 RepID=A0AAD4GXT2_ASPNN|nr:hypothetical protein FE257_002861 [Aspergillus nanangensis]